MLLHNIRQHSLDVKVFTKVTQVVIFDITYCTIKIIFLKTVLISKKNVCIYIV